MMNVNLSRSILITKVLVTARERKYIILTALFRKKIFVLDEITQQNAAKVVRFFNKYNNPCRFCIPNI